MKIQLASDLHLESTLRAFPGERLIAPAYGADILVLAGDIANGMQAIDLFKDWPVPVLYIAGNHEFYGHSLEQTRADLAKDAAGTSIRFLDNATADFGGVRFLGCTLWTDYRLYSDCPQSELMRNAERCINDHRRIQFHGVHFRAADALHEHEQSCAWLERELARPYDGKTVVITHHGPHPRSIHSRYAGDPTNAAFVSNLERLLLCTDLWLHGHVHDSFDYIESGCRVIANPLGYARNRYGVDSVKQLQYENPSFEWACVIDFAETAATKAASSAASSSTAGNGPLTWICRDCADRILGPAIVLSHTYHAGVCDVCHRQRGVTSSDDFEP